MAGGSTPNPHHEVKSDMILIGIVCAVWLIPWFILTWAAKLAGGNPTYSPFDVLNFGQMGSTYNTDGHNLVWCHYVGAFGPIRVWMFWAVLVMIGSFFRGPGQNFVFPWKDGIFFDL